MVFSRDFYRCVVEKLALSGVATVQKTFRVSSFNPPLRIT